MAKEPSDMVERLQGQVQSTLTKHTRRLDALDVEIGELRHGQEEFIRNSNNAMGTASIAETRIGEPEHTVEATERRVSKLEEKA